MPRVQIKDDPLGGIFVDRDPVHVGSGNSVDWDYTGSVDFVVCFASGSPFAGNVFRSAGRHVNSGAASVAGNPHKVYKYLVITDAGGVIDPGVIVH